MDHPVLGGQHHRPGLPLPDRDLAALQQDHPRGIEPLLALAAKTVGKMPTTIACINDDTAVNQSNMAPLRAGGFAQLKLRTVMDENFSVPLADATPLIQQLRRTRPDLVLLGTTATSDSRLLLQKINEFGLGQGKVPIIAPSANWGTPEMLKTMGAANLEGVIGVAGNWGSKQEAALNRDLEQRAKEPWLVQDTLSTYGHVLLIADALERAGSADRDKLMAALQGDRHDHRPGEAVPWRPAKVRGKRAPGRPGAGRVPVEGRRAEDRAAGGRCGGGADLAAAELTAAPPHDGIRRPARNVPAGSRAAGCWSGCLYGLMCAGLGLIFGIMRVINFAQGDFMMLAMYAGLNGVALIGARPAWAFPVAMAVPASAALLFFGLGAPTHCTLVNRVSGSRVLRLRGRRPHRTADPHARPLAGAAEWRADAVRLLADARSPNAAADTLVDGRPAGRRRRDAVLQPGPHLVGAVALAGGGLTSRSWRAPASAGSCARSPTTRSPRLYMGIDVERAFRTAFGIGLA